MDALAGLAFGGDGRYGGPANGPTPQPRRFQGRCQGRGLSDEWGRLNLLALDRSRGDVAGPLQALS